jgi:hypothetical protein
MNLEPETQQRIENLSDEQLLDMIRNSNDYRPEAVSFAESEVLRRGGKDVLEKRMAPLNTEPVTEVTTGVVSKLRVLARKIRPVSGWPMARLAGESHVIPRICPSCLASAAVEFRYSYQPLTIVSTKFCHQTFYYCEDCAVTLTGYLKHQARCWWLALVGGFCGCLTMFVFSHPASSLLFGIASAIALGYSSVALHKRYMLRHYPRTAKQLLWGPSAYYTGRRLFAAGCPSEYRAIRREWLRALVVSNKNQVDDETYRRWMA